MYQVPSYWGNSYYMRANFVPIWNTGFPKAVQMIKEAVQGERNDELFYDELINLAPSQEQVAIIESIRNDERGHNKMFREMYRALTGQEIAGISSEQYERVQSYTEGLQRALMGSWVRWNDTATSGLDCLLASIRTRCTVSYWMSLSTLPNTII